MRHSLFIVAAIGRQLFLDAMERLAYAGYVAMTENRPASRNEWFARLCFLCRYVADHCLRGS